MIDSMRPLGCRDGNFSVGLVVSTTVGPPHEIHANFLWSAISAGASCTGLSSRGASFDGARVPPIVILLRFLDISFLSVNARALPELVCNSLIR